MNTYNNTTMMLNNSNNNFDYAMQKSRADIVYTIEDVYWKVINTFNRLFNDTDQAINEGQGA